MKYAAMVTRSFLAAVLICTAVGATAQTASYSSLATLPGSDTSFGTLVEGNDGNLYVAGETGIYRVSLAGDVTEIADLGSTSSSVQGHTYGNLVIGVDTWLYGNFNTGIYWIHTQGTSLNQIYTYNNSTGTASDMSYTTMAGGGSGEGTVYTLLNDSTNSYLYELTSPGQGSLYCTIPDPKVSAVIEGSDGNVYGTTYGASGSKFFSCAGGTYALLATFGNGTTNDADGSGSFGPLVQGANGNFYGTAQNLGADSAGTIFEMTTAGAITSLHSFNGTTDGGLPNSGLLLASDGNFYGVTTSGGTGWGTVFRMTPTGTFTELLDFSDTVIESNNQLVQAHDGNLYGATATGEIYKITLSPSLAAPVQMQMSPATLGLGQTATLTWSLKNAFSKTANQCYATGTGANWSGQEASSGTLSIDPSATGTYSYALSCGGVESNSATLTVLNATKTTPTATPATVPVGSNVTLTAPVTQTAGSGIPTGSVQFLYGTLSLGTETLNGSGVATLTAAATGIPVGSYTITAKYSGDSSNAPSSGSVQVTVVKASTATTLTVSPNPLPANHNATLTATVKRSAGSGDATGSVTFSSGSLQIGQATLNSGVATFTASDAGLPADNYPVTAHYNGDASDNASTSSTTSVTVQ